MKHFRIFIGILLIFTAISIVVVGLSYLFGGPSTLFTLDFIMMALKFFGYFLIGLVCLVVFVAMMVFGIYLIDKA